MFLKQVLLAVVLSSLMGCSTSIMKYEKSDQLGKNDEFQKAVIIVKADEKTPDVTPTPTPTPTATPAAGAAKKGNKKKKRSRYDSLLVKKDETAPATPAAPVVTQRQPDIEDDAGFIGRRPINDPYHVGEEITYDVHYFKVSAGELKLKVDPFSVVNGLKAYTFITEIRTKGVFSNFYSVEDRVETLVDYATLVPSVYELHVKETNQLREAKALFDNKKNIATFWEKKVTTKSGEEQKKEQWEILPYSQNVFSAVFYMRAFQWEEGKQYAFRVANDNENLVFTGKAVRREILDTELGPMKAVVIEPKITLKGAFKPIGDIYVWLSDDEHKYILRIECKIKIGTLVAEVIKIQPGK